MIYPPVPNLLPSRTLSHIKNLPPDLMGPNVTIHLTHLTSKQSTRPQANHQDTSSTLHTDQTRPPAIQQAKRHSLLFTARQTLLCREQEPQNSRSQTNK
jgi:hypothetical protein